MTTQLVGGWVKSVETGRRRICDWTGNSGNLAGGRMMRVAEVKASTLELQSANPPNPECHSLILEST